MKTTSEILKQEFDFKANHLGLRLDDNLWQHDKWIVTINGQDFEYSTGIGHRQPAKVKWQRGMENYRGFKDEATYYLNGRFKQDKESLEVVNSKLEAMTQVKPLNIDNVLYSLVMDAQAGQEMFEDFCDNFGYDSDSRKAFDIYQACQKNAVKVRQFLNIEEASEAFQDY
ncbi:MAG: hypothetical protein CMH22_06045 [Methylophaga sp.]|mgnify:CR=1 FL=1|nr:hypothetical protein [Methylophaga sp.]|tara:strand:+ start:58103 stop:58612 length:510 start_codon:yes stop_codon:yes gene_type:complete